MISESNFSRGEYVVYPAHGVGQIVNIEVQEVDEYKLPVYVISFEKDRMTLRLPIAKSTSAGLRCLSSQKEMEQALKILKTRTRIRRAMWSRRAQEYESKINSGDPISIAEVIRDLHRSTAQPDQSYSERQIYKAALSRLTRELAVIEQIDEEAATTKVEGLLSAA